MKRGRKPAITGAALTRVAAILKIPSRQRGQHYRMLGEQLGVSPSTVRDYVLRMERERRA